MDRTCLVPEGSGYISHLGPSVSHAARRSPPVRLAIIGGGVSGLTAAHRLGHLLPHAELRLYEASGRLGGPLHTLHAGAAVLEQGADSFLTKTPWAIDLCRKLGLAGELVPTSEVHRRALVVRDGRLVPVPDGFVLMRPHNLAAVLKSPVLSRAGKLRLLAEPLVRAPAGISDADYDESVASFATRRLGREAFERLVQPLMAGIFVADATQLSLAATYPEFLAAEREHGSLWAGLRHSRKQAAAPGNSAAAEPSPGAGARYGAFVTLHGGMSRFIEALADQLPPGAVRLQTSVTCVAKTSDQRWAVSAAGDIPETFDGVLIATPAPHASRLVESFDAALAQLLGRIECATSAVVTLVYPRAAVARPLDGFGAVVPTIENRPIVALSFPSVKFPHCSLAEHVPIRTFMGGVLRPELADRADDELAAVVRQQLAELVGASGEPLEMHVARWREAMPQYRVGHLKLVSQIEQQAVTHRGLELAGSAYRGVGIPQCIRSGHEAAERLAQQLAAATERSG